MRQILILCLLLFLLLIACNRSKSIALDKPESIVYNSFTQSYLISNSGNGKIISQNKAGENSLFCQYRLVSPKGMAISGNTLYVADMTGVVSFDLTNGKLLRKFSVPKSRFLNDVAVSPENIVYASDTQTNAIFLINPQADKIETFTHPSLSSPNGLHYLEESGKKYLYIVSFRENAPLQRLDLESRELTDVPGIYISQADGIIRDNQGLWYISSWQDRCIYRISSDLKMMNIFLRDLTSPADIYFNSSANEFCIPLMEANQLQFIRFESK